MRIHTNHISEPDIWRAARAARVDVVTLTNHGSRSRSHAFTVKLEGESRRRPNGGSSGAGSGYAATWDQWGVFLSILFDLDPEMVTPYYADRADYHRQTADRFLPNGWPADAHGDHTFRWNGSATSCTKCSARQVR